MLSVLLSDPMLKLLEPLELVKISQISKEARDVVDHHRKTQAHYPVRKYTSKDTRIPVRFKARQHLYQLYPSVKTLTLELGGWETKVDPYLRPTLQSLTLVLPLQIVKPKDCDWWYLRNTWHFAPSFQQIMSFLQEHPESQLKNFRLVFESTVYFTLEDGGELVVDYDQRWPIYESYDLHAETPDIDPASYLCLVDPTQHALGELRDSLYALATSWTWKSFVVPGLLPGATECPGATLVESGPYGPYDWQEMEASIYRLFDKKLNGDTTGEVSTHTLHDGL